MNTQYEFDEEMIAKLNLKLTNDPVVSEYAKASRVFEFRGLPQVYIMEQDLYGNPMRVGSCFLAFYGNKGFIGKEVDVNALQECTRVEILQWIEANAQS